MDNSKRLERCECCGKILVEWALDGVCYNCGTPTKEYEAFLDEVELWEQCMELEHPSDKEIKDKGLEWLYGNGDDGANQG